MKLHASVGADILSAIDFPYPVVPIVRHHHENWDGSGYPDGIKGTDIPIGARILSVVDCFDALTSDRPYRPRLTDSDALGILLERRGSMYDSSRCRYLHSSSPRDCSRRRGDNSYGFAEKDRHSSSESREGTYFRSSSTVTTARRTCLYSKISREFLMVPICRRIPLLSI